MIHISLNPLHNEKTEFAHVLASEVGSRNFVLCATRFQITTLQMSKWTVFSCIWNSSPTQGRVHAIEIRHGEESDGKA